MNPATPHSSSSPDNQSSSDELSQSFIDRIVHDGIATHFQDPSELGLAQPLELNVGVHLVRQTTVRHGGLGVVAEYREAPFGRKVAVKLIRHCDITPNAKARFFHECEITQSLQHPGIIPVFLAGEGDNCGPFYVMRWVDGADLEKCIQAFHSSSKARLTRNCPEFRRLLESFKAVCLTTDYAHRQGVWHCDLKPANVMLTDDDITYVIDWGLAIRARDVWSSPREPSPTTSAELPTDPVMRAVYREKDHRIARTAGTWGYMSPEQACGDREEIDQRTDIFSLGAMLFHLLTGSPPRNFDQLKAFMIDDGTDSDWLKRELRKEQIRTETIPRARWSLKGRTQVPNALSSICAKSMSRDPDRRYETAKAIADEIASWQSREPVRAHRYTWLGVWLLWFQRNPIASLILVIAAISLAVLAFGLDRFRRQEVELRASADTLRDFAEIRQLAFLQHSASQQNVQRDSSRNIFPLPSSQTSWDYQRISYESQLQVRRQFGLAVGIAGIVSGAVNLENKLALAGDAGGGLELWDIEHQSLRKRIWSARYSAEEDGKLPSEKPQLHHYQSRDSGSLMDWEPCAMSIASILSDEFLVASSNGKAFTVDANGKLVEIASVKQPLVVAAANDDGDRILLAGQRGLLIFGLRTDQGEWELVNCETPIENEYISAAWLPLGKCWALGTRNHAFAIIEHGTDTWLKSNRLQGPVTSITVAQSMQDGEPVDRVIVATNTAQISAFVVSPKSREISGSRYIAPRNASDTDFTGTIGEQDSSIHFVKFASDGSSLFTVNASRRVDCFDIRSDPPAKLWGSECFANNTPRRGVLESLEEKLPKELFETMPVQFHHPAALVQSLKEGNRLLTMGCDSCIAIWDLELAQQTGITVSDCNLGPLPSCTISPPQSRRLWAVDRTGNLRVIDLKSQAVIATISAHPAGGQEVIAIGSNGVVATIGNDRHIRFWLLDQETIREAKPSREHETDFCSIASDDNGKWIAATDKGGYLNIWECDTWKRVYRKKFVDDKPDGTSPTLTGRIAFAPSGKKVAAFGPGQASLVVDLMDWKESINPLSISGKGGTALAWSPVNEELMLLGDDFFRIVLVGSPEARPTVWSPFTTISKKARFIASTPDKKRFAVLVEGGQIGFVDTRFVELMHLAQSTNRRDRQILFDAANSDLLVVGDDGSFETWNTFEKTPSEIDSIANNSSNPWKISELPHEKLTGRRANLNSIWHSAIDKRGKLCAAKPNSSGTNKIEFFRETENGDTRETIELDSELLQSGNSIEKISLQVAHDNRVWIAVRVRTNIPASHDGRLLVGTKNERGSWEFSKVFDGDNAGFTPHLVFDNRGQPKGVFHVRYNNNILYEPARSWGRSKRDYQVVGAFGDGLGLVGLQDTTSDITHLFYRSNRFNSDPGTQATYAIWNNKAESLECSMFHPQMVPTGLAKSTFISPNQSTMQHPIVVAREFVQGKLCVKYSFRRLGLGSVDTLAELTLPEYQSLFYSITSNNEIVCVVVDDKSRKVWLVEYTHSAWTKQSLEGLIAPEIRAFAIHANSSGGIVLLGTPNGNQISNVYLVSREDKLKTGLGELN